MPDLVIAARTHTGTVRSHNEDAYVVGDIAATQTESASWERTIALTSPILLGVADGIGGHKAGGLASTIAAKHLASAIITQTEAFEHALHAIDTELLALGRAPETFRLGTTFCGILFGPAPVGICIGDGFMALRDGDALVPFGPTWEDVAKTSLLEAALGGRDPESALPLVWQAIPYRDGARYVIATDGVIRALSYEAFEAAVQNAGSPSQCIARIFTAALQPRAPDNLTCIVADLHTPR